MWLCVDGRRCLLRHIRRPLLKIVLRKLAEVDLLGKQLHLHDQRHEVFVLLVDGQLVRLVEHLPMAHDDERQRHVDAVVRHPLDQEGQPLVFGLGCHAHQVGRPFVDQFHERLDLQLALHLVDIVGPLLERLPGRLLPGGGLVVFQHLELLGTQRDDRQTGGESTAEVGLGHLAV